MTAKHKQWVEVGELQSAFSPHRTPPPPKAVLIMRQNSTEDKLKATCFMNLYLWTHRLPSVSNDKLLKLYCPDNFHHPHLLSPPPPPNGESLLDIPKEKERERDRSNKWERSNVSPAIYYIYCNQMEVTHPSKHFPVLFELASYKKPPALLSDTYDSTSFPFPVHFWKMNPL